MPSGPATMSSAAAARAWKPVAMPTATTIIVIPSAMPGPSASRCMFGDR